MILQLPGYVPIQHLAGRTRGYLNRRLQKWYQDRKPAGASSRLVISEQAKINLNGIAERVALSLIHSKGSLVDLLTKSGNLVQLDTKTLELPHEPIYGRSFAAKWFKDLVYYKPVTLETFAGDDWQENLLNSPIYELSDTVKPNCLIDWKNGILDVSQLMREQNMALSHNEEESPDSGLLSGNAQWAHDMPRRLPTGKLAKFLPFHGCPVLVPLAWRDILEVDGLANEATDEFEWLRLLSPVKRILAFLSKHPEATKEEVKAAIFSKFSAREFQRHWTLAVQERPEISRPGRKRKS